MYWVRLPKQILVEKIVDGLGDGGLGLGSGRLLTRAFRFSFGQLLGFERTIALDLCQSLRVGGADRLPGGSDQAQEQGSGNH